MFWFYSSDHGVPEELPVGVSYEIKASYAGGRLVVFSTNRELSKSDVCNLDLYPVCPKCECVISFYPAISRRDNQTRICADCGTLEALEDFKSHHEVA